jgi:hypothetical protein
MMRFRTTSQFVLDRARLSKEHGTVDRFGFASAGGNRSVRGTVVSILKLPGYDPPCHEIEVEEATP